MRGHLALSVLALLLIVMVSGLMWWTQPTPLESKAISSPGIYELTALDHCAWHHGLESWGGPSAESFNIALEMLLLAQAMEEEGPEVLALWEMRHDPTLGGLAAVQRKITKGASSIPEVLTLAQEKLFHFDLTETARNPKVRQLHLNQIMLYYGGGLKYFPSPEISSEEVIAARLRVWEMERQFFCKEHDLLPDTPWKEIEREAHLRNDNLLASLLVSFSLMETQTDALAQQIQALEQGQPQAFPRIRRPLVTVGYVGIE